MYHKIHKYVESVVLDENQPDSVRVEAAKALAIASLSSDISSIADSIKNSSVDFSPLVEAMADFGSPKHPFRHISNG